MKKATFIILIASLLLSGCATPIAYKLIRAIPEPVGEDFGKIVLIRPNRLSGSALSFNVYINNYAVDRINNARYKEYKLPTGTYNLYIQSNERSNIVQLELNKGETIYLEAVLLMSMLSTSMNLYQINETEAIERIKTMKQSEINYTPDKYPLLPLKN